MGRRFTDSAKWTDDWFGDLDKNCKLAWIYLLDTCTAAGRWKKSLKNLNFHCDTEYTEDNIKNIFNGRLLDYGTFYFIPKFLAYQYPKGLNSSKPAIVSVRDEIMLYKLDSIVRVSLGNNYLMVNDCLNDYLIIKDKDKDKDSSITSITSKALIQEIIDYWNKGDLPQCVALSDARKEKFKARVVSQHFREHWKKAIDKLNASKFAKGSSESGWKASIDWFIGNDNNYLKALEGKYDGKKLGYFDTL